jgi:hypothetical protein
MKFNVLSLKHVYKDFKYRRNTNSRNWVKRFLNKFRRKDDRLNIKEQFNDFYEIKTYNNFVVGE